MWDFLTIFWQLVSTNALLLLFRCWCTLFLLVFIIIHAKIMAIVPLSYIIDLLLACKATPPYNSLALPLAFFFEKPCMPWREQACGPIRSPASCVRTDRHGTDARDKALANWKCRTQFLRTFLGKYEEKNETEGVASIARHGARVWCGGISFIFYFFGNGYLSVNRFFFLKKSSRFLTIWCKIYCRDLCHLSPKRVTRTRNDALPGGKGLDVTLRPSHSS